MRQLTELDVPGRRSQFPPNGHQPQPSPVEPRDGERPGNGNGQVETESTTAELADDSQLLARLRAGDERAFFILINRFHGSMVRLARTYVPSAADAEEVAQEAWLGVLTGLDRFEERSSLRTWIFRILTYQAMSRGKRAQRTIPFSGLVRSTDERAHRSVQPERFLGASDELSGHWAHPPQPWGEPEEHVITSETMALISKTIDSLPPSQRRVMTLRDIEGWTSAQVCELLGLSEGNQRVLLHRARSQVRTALEQYLNGGTY